MADAAVLSVSRALELANNAVATLGSLAVVGEVAGYKGPSRGGHLFFSLKDEGGTLPVVLWGSRAARLPFRLQDGQQVQAVGSFDVYKGSGRLNFVLRSLALAGEGMLRQQIEELARRLRLEGLMDASRKLPVPAFCQRICVVTSLTGAVIEDVKRTLARRNPLVAIDVVGCAVQGPDAPATIVQALQLAQQTKPDAILLVRGGGSLEDLMAFNDERVARAVAASTVPVVTGIGHEPDYSIADMVAARSVSTPTGAAESVAPSVGELTTVIDGRAQRLERRAQDLLFRHMTEVDALGQRLQHAMGAILGAARTQVTVFESAAVLKGPDRLLDAQTASLELTAARLEAAMARRLDAEKAALAAAPAALRQAGNGAAGVRALQTSALGQRLGTAGPALLTGPQRLLARAGASLDALSPLRVLARGYAIVQDAQGHVVDSTAQAQDGQRLQVRLQDGLLGVEVVSKQTA